MSHHNTILHETLVEQLRSELRVYEDLLEELGAAGWPTRIAVVLAEQGDRVQRCAEILPTLVVPIARFLITRTSLSRRLVGSGQGREAALAALHAEHVQAVHALRRAAMPPGEED